MKIKMLKQRTHHDKIVWNKGDIYKIKDIDVDYYIVKLFEDDKNEYIWCGVEKSAIDEYEIMGLEDED